MKVPPVQPSADYPRTRPDSLPIARDYIGWILLAVIFAVLIASAIKEGDATPQNEIRLAEEEPDLRQAVALIHSPVKDQQKQGRVLLTGLEDQAKPYAGSDPRQAEVYAASQTLLGAPVPPNVLATMAKSKDPEDRNAAIVYGSSRLTPAQASALSSKFEKIGFVGKLMRAQAFAKAGNPGLLEGLSASSTVGFAMVFLLVVAIGSGSLCAYHYLWTEWNAGRLVPKGLPARLGSLLDADRLAIKAALLVGLFLVLSAVPDVIDIAFHVKADIRAKELMIGGGMLLAVPWLFSLPVAGKVFSLASLGASWANLGPKVKLGLLGFAIEIPIAITLTVIGQLLFSRFHHASHPATVELETSHDWLTILSTFALASIVAPFWEELMFRGLLFPAISRVTRSVVYGALISSFLFGVIHPQGLPLWGALMALAGVSCALSYYTNSLVPSMVMHAAHNTTLLVLTLLLS